MCRKEYVNNRASDVLIIDTSMLSDIHFKVVENQGANGRQKASIYISDYTQAKAILIQLETWIDRNREAALAQSRASDSRDED